MLVRILAKQTCSLSFGVKRNAGTEVFVRKERDYHLVMLHAVYNRPGTELDLGRP